MKLIGKTILITGGTGGIGLELGKELRERGNVVVVTGRDEKKLEAARRSGLNAMISDVSDAAAIEALHDRLLVEFPALDVLVNNAGIMRNLRLDGPRALIDVTREIDINLSGPIRMIQKFLPHLLSRKEALIVNVSSGLAFVPFPLSPVYSGAKAAMHAYTQCLRIQLKGSDVGVVELAPPGVETPLFRDEFPELSDQKAMPPKELVAHAIAGIESGKLEIRPGQSNLLKIMSRLAPRFALGQIAKSTKVKGARSNVSK